GLAGFIAGMLEMLGAVRFYLVALALLSFAESRPRGTGAWQVWLKDHPWTLFALAALLMAPSSVVSRIKFGGGTNSFYSNCMLIAGVIVGWTDVILRTPRPAMRRLGCAVLLAVMASGVYVRSNLLEWLPLWARVDDNSHEIAYRLAKRYPGQIFFPWQTLST